MNTVIAKDRKRQNTYGIAVKYLNIIGNFPRHVEKGHLGYFMTLDRIKESIKSFNPKDWYKDAKFEEQHISFEGLDVEDQRRLKEVMENLTAPSMSQKELEDKCTDCYHLCSEFCDETLGIRKK